MVLFLINSKPSWPSAFILLEDSSMGYPRERSRPSNARRQRRRSHGESVDSASDEYTDEYADEYADDFEPVLSWLHNVDDSRSQYSSLTERVHHGQYICQGLCVAL